MREVELTQDKAALIDDEDYDRVTNNLWHAVEHHSGVWYARRIENIMLHRFIMNASSDVEIDHKNGDGLDCQKDNLRIVTRRENSLNRQRTYAASGYRGVYFSGYVADRWRACIRTPQGLIHLGTFSTPEEAALAYDKAAIQYNGAFAFLNFPESAL
jgi:hypothetical protein